MSLSISSWDDMSEAGGPASTSEPADEALVAAAQKDPAAFGPLYQRYVGPIYRYCYLRLGSRERAEDATSEVFLKALAGFSGFRGGLFAAWLFRIAQNAVIDAQRRRRSTSPVEEAWGLADRSAGPEEETLARDEARRLRAGMAHLSEEQRAVLELQLAGWPRERIAAALTKSPEAVKMLRYRAIVRLRALLAEGPDGD